MKLFDETGAEFDVRRLRLGPNDYLWVRLGSDWDADPDELAAQLNVVFPPFANGLPRVVVSAGGLDLTVVET